MSVHRTIALLLGVAAVVASCGGKTVLITGVIYDAGSSGGDSGDGVTVDPGSGGCVDVVVTSAARSCAVDSDCTFARSGTLCAGGCSCAVDPVNQAASARIATELASAGIEPCRCAFAYAVVCSEGECAACTGGASEPSACAIGGTDGGVILDDGGVDYDGGFEDDSGIIILDGGIDYDGGVILDDGGAPCPSTSEVWNGASCDADGLDCVGEDYECGVFTLTDCSCQGRRWSCPIVVCVDAGPPSMCEVGASCTAGTSCTLTGAGPCDSDALLECKTGAMVPVKFPCNAGTPGCGWAGTGPDGCSESCECQSGSMTCTGNCPDAGLSQP
jgi:hypothetical protein